MDWAGGVVGIGGEGGMEIWRMGEGEFEVHVVVLHLTLSASNEGRTKPVSRSEKEGQVNNRANGYNPNPRKLVIQPSIVRQASR